MQSKRIKSKKIKSKKIQSLIRFLTVCVAAAVFTAACGVRKEERYHAEFLNLFDTVTQIAGYAPNKEEFTELVSEIHDELEIYHKLYDIYHDYAGIANMKTINDNAGKAPVKVDQKIMDLLKEAKAMYDETDGRMNVAMGSVLAIWHEYRTTGIEDPASAAVPPMEELSDAALHTDISKVILDEAASTVYLEDPDMRLDVGAIAKGYAVEQAAKSLEEKGVKHLLLSVGGNVRAIGGRGDGTPWKVDIQNPDMESGQKAITMLDITEESLVSSGDYQRYYTVDGVRYHHIINPDTLMPADYFRAVSIVCKDSGRADGLSTAVYNMPYEEGLAFIERLPDVEALWVMPDMTVRVSSGFEACQSHE